MNLVKWRAHGRVWFVLTGTIWLGGGIAMVGVAEYLTGVLLRDQEYVAWGIISLLSLFWFYLFARLWVKPYSAWLDSQRKAFFTRRKSALLKGVRTSSHTLDDSVQIL